MTFICSESLPHNLCFLTTFSPVPLYKTLDVDMWILGRISLLSTISISKRFSAFSPFPFRHLFSFPFLPPSSLLLSLRYLFFLFFFSFPSILFGRKFCPHSFSTHQRFLTHSHLFILSSIQKKDREGIHQQKAVESYSAGGRRRVGDQTMLARYSVNALCLSLSHRFSPPSSFTKALHLLRSSTSSSRSFFFFSLCYIFSQPWR